MRGVSGFFQILAKAATIEFNWNQTWDSVARTLLLLIFKIVKGFVMANYVNIAKRRVFIILDSTRAFVFIYLIIENKNKP